VRVSQCRGSIVAQREGVGSAARLPISFCAKIHALPIRGEGVGPAADADSSP